MIPNMLRNSEKIQNVPFSLLKLSQANSDSPVVATSDRFDLPSANMGDRGSSLLLIYYYYASYTLDYTYITMLSIC